MSAITRTRFLPGLPLHTLPLHTLLLAALCTTQAAQATLVSFQTSLGDFEVNLFDEYTPATVANFLTYVNEGHYDNTLIHRSQAGFVVQGGGFLYNPPDLSAATAAVSHAPVTNEPYLSNKRGTLAMAKQANNPNSATNQWFFNLGDNSANLDEQNSGFTVFGQISAEGLAIMDAIAQLPRLGAQNLNPAFTSVPVRNYTQQDANQNVPVSDAHLVIVHAITVIDARPNTAAGLNPELTTHTPSEPARKKKGALGGLGLLLLGLGLTRAWHRRRKAA